jgi:site-specific recombinase XerD
MTALAPTLQAFFTERLARQKNASPHTVASYRDTLRLLLGFVAERTGTPPARMQVEDLDAPLIGAFLDHLEDQRANSVRSRNTRLAAIHSLFRFAALQHPEHAALIARVLAIPPKRYNRAVVCFLDGEEIEALLAAPDTSRWIGRRDHALLLLAVQTGLRVSELTGLCCRDVHLGAGPTCAVSARDANSAARRSPPRRSPCCGAGWPNDEADPRIRCSRLAAVGRSVVTRSRCSSPTTRSRRGSAAPRSTPRRSPRTSCVTRPP